MEAEKQQASDTADALSKRAKNLLARAQNLTEYALEKLNQGDESTARQTLQTKASIKGALEKAAAKASHNYALAQKLDEIIASTQQQLLDLLALAKQLPLEDVQLDPCPGGQAATRSQPSWSGWSSPTLRSFSSMDLGSAARSPPGPSSPTAYAGAASSSTTLPPVAPGIGAPAAAAAAIGSTADVGAYPAAAHPSAAAASAASGAAHAGSSADHSPQYVGAQPFTSSQGPVRSSTAPHGASSRPTSSPDIPSIPFALTEARGTSGNILSSGIVGSSLGSSTTTTTSVNGNSMEALTSSSNYSPPATPSALSSPAMQPTDVEFGRVPSPPPGQGRGGQFSGEGHAAAASSRLSPEWAVEVSTPFAESAGCGMPVGVAHGAVSCPAVGASGGPAGTEGQAQGVRKRAGDARQPRGEAAGSEVGDGGGGGRPAQELNRWAGGEEGLEDLLDIVRDVVARGRSAGGLVRVADVEGLQEAIEQLVAKRRRLH